MRTAVGAQYIKITLHWLFHSLYRNCRPPCLSLNKQTNRVWETVWFNQTFLQFSRLRWKLLQTFLTKMRRRGETLQEEKRVVLRWLKEEASLNVLIKTEKEFFSVFLSGWWRAQNISERAYRFIFQIFKKCLFSELSYVAVPWFRLLTVTLHTLCL